MALLKEDGSLDVEHINQLPLWEYMDEMGKLTQVQVEEYLSKLPINETNKPIIPEKTDCSMEELLNQGCVNAKEFLNNL